MATYVIQSWHASDQPNANGNYIEITGRQEGLISWCLTVLGISAQTTIKVSATRIEFSAGSLSGSLHHIIPLPGVCSMIYGFHKPWQEAIAIAVVLIFMISTLFIAVLQSGFGTVLGVICGAGAGILYYFLKQTLTLGFLQNSGAASVIQFKPSVIEGQSVDQQSSAYVCELAQSLIEVHQRKLLNP